MNRPLVPRCRDLLFSDAGTGRRARACWWSTIRTSRSRLPRPIIIWPPHPMPHPGRRRRRPSYKIKELEVQARLIDQVAQVQVSQTFVNTGSRPMEVAFVFPLPYDGAIEQMTLMIDGKEYPGQAAGRQGGPADVRGDRAQEPRPGAVGMDGHGPVPHQRLSRAGRARAAPSRSAIRSSAASRRG